MSKEHLRTARKLIKQGRYDHACDILRQLDDPIAQAWLEKLETMKPRRKRQNSFALSDYRPLLPIVGLALAVALVMGLMYIFSVIVNEQGEAGAVRDTEGRLILAEGWDEVYMTLVNYCLPLVSYGSETCTDWADSILGNPFDANRANFDLVKSCLSVGDIETTDGYLLFGACLSVNGIGQPPGY